MEKRAIVRLGIGRVYHHTKQWQQPVSYGRVISTHGCTYKTFDN